MNVKEEIYNIIDSFNDRQLVHVLAILESVKQIVAAEFEDEDYTKTTSQEREQIEHAENSGFIPEDEIDWDNLDKYV